VARNPSQVDKSLGRRLRDKRTASGLSEEQLAEKVQIDPKEINAYERGTKRLSADRLLLMARALDVRPDYFFRFSDEGENGVAADDEGRFEEIVAFPTKLDEALGLHRAFMSIGNAALRRAIVTFVVDLARSEAAD
jgi:transcriptional regulator with XRE-family HTH domain